MANSGHGEFHWRKLYIWQYSLLKPLKANNLVFTFAVLSFEVSIIFVSVWHMQEKQVKLWKKMRKITQWANLWSDFIFRSRCCMKVLLHFLRAGASAWNKAVWLYSTQAAQGKNERVVRVKRKMSLFDTVFTWHWHLAGAILFSYSITALREHLSEPHIHPDHVSMH